MGRRLTAGGGGRRRADDGGAPWAPARSGIIGASSSAGPRREKDVNKMREFTVARLTKEQGLGVVYWQRNAPARSVRPARSKRRLRAVGAAWEEAGRRYRQRGARGIYRRGEGVRVPRICTIREGLARRLRERGGELTRAGKAGGWGR